MLIRPIELSLNEFERKKGIGGSERAVSNFGKSLRAQLEQLEKSIAM